MSSDPSPGVHRRGWRYYGQQRPAFAAEPGRGQESVWDYPRPPRVEADRREVVVLAGDVEAMKQRSRNYARRQLTWMRSVTDRQLRELHAG